MSEIGRDTQFADRSRVIAVIGVLLLLVGVAAAALGPMELYCFYLFAEGGRFHYEGFGFGSFMFAVIAIQVAGYYVIAMICISLGWGHLRLRRWARRLSLSLLGFWFIVGVPLVIVFMAMLVISKKPSLSTVAAVLPLLVLLYPVIPGLLRRFYRSRDVRMTFETRDSAPHWSERIPLSILVLCTLYGFYIIALHMAILFRGAFPLAGVLITDMAGVALADASILWLACLIWGTLRQQSWAWWGALLYFSVMTVSVFWTFSRLSLADILRVMRFAPLETRALSGKPMQGMHLAAFLGLPLLATLGLIIYSRRSFGTSGPRADGVRN